MLLVYFGNKLSKHGSSKSVMETLEPLLSEFLEIKSYSSRKNQVNRLMNMLYGFFADGLRSDIIMIDVYSTLNFYYAFILSVLCILFRKPYILFLHGGNLPDRFSHSKRKFGSILKGAKKIVAPSLYLKNFFEKNGFKVNLIPNSIDIGKFPYAKREFDCPRLVYVRGFSKVYNPLMTIRAFQIVCQDFPGAQLLMFGSDIDGTLRETENLIKHLNLGGNVKIVGKMSQENWVQSVKDSNIMVSNPTIDNTPVSIIEGMALGLVIVSTRVGGISHLINDGEDGLLVNSGDHSGLAQQISQIILDKNLREKLQTAARAKAESFCWDKIKFQWKILLTE